MRTIFNTKIKILITALGILIALMVVFLIFSVKNQNLGSIKDIPLNSQGTQSAEHEKNSQRINQQNISSYKKEQRSADLRTSLPFKDANFEVDYDYASGSFIVKLFGDNQTSKTAFLVWLDKKGFKEEDVKPVYIEDAEKTFKVLKTSYLKEPIPVTGEIKIYFSSVVNRDKLIVQIEPEKSAYQDLDESMTVLTISPAQSWGYGQNFRIRILKDSEDLSGKHLDGDFEVEFQTQKYVGE